MHGNRNSQDSSLTRPGVAAIHQKTFALSDAARASVVLGDTIQLRARNRKRCRGHFQHATSFSDPWSRRSPARTTLGPEEKSGVLVRIGSKRSATAPVCSSASNLANELARHLHTANRQKPLCNLAKVFQVPTRPGSVTRAIDSGSPWPLHEAQ